MYGVREQKVHRCVRTLEYILHLARVSEHTIDRSEYPTKTVQNILNQYQTSLYQLSIDKNIHYCVLVAFLVDTFSHLSTYQSVSSVFGKNVDPIL